MPPVKAILVPGGSRTSVSARRLAARKSRLSIIAAVIVRWLTIEPARGRQAEPVWRSKRSAAWSRKNSKALRRSIRRDALGGQAFELDGFDLGAVLLALAAALRLLVVVELALDAVDGAVEEVDEGPEQVVEIGLEAGVGERRDERVEDVGERRLRRLGLGQRPRIGLVLEGAVAVELQLGEEVVGRGGGVRGLEVGVVVVGRHGDVLSSDSAAPIAAFTAIT